MIMMIMMMMMLRRSPAFLLSLLVVLINSSNSSLLFAMSVVSSAYLRLFIVMPPIRNPLSSSLRAALMICSLQMLKRDGESIHPFLTPFPMLNH